MVTPIDVPLYRRIWSLTWPMILTNALELAVGLLDFLWVSPFGPAATAAIGVSRQVTLVVEAAAAAITAGVLTLVSQGTGARSNQMKAVALQSIRCVLLFAFPMSIAGFLFSRPLLVALQVSDETLAWGDAYLRVYFAGLVLSWGILVGMAICRGAGDVWTPLKITVGVSALNVGLSYVFIHGAGPVPAFGVMGAALATVAARSCGVLVYLALIRRVGQVANLPDPLTPFPSPSGRGERGEGWQPAPRIGSILRVGVPMALANVLRHGSRLIFLAIVGASALGVSFQAAVGFGMQMRLLGVLIALAFQTATATLVGQAIGTGDREHAALIGRRSVQLLGMLMALQMGIIVVLAEPLAGLFIDSTEGAHLGAQVLRWFALAQLFSALSIGLQGALLGAGDTAPALRYTLISEWGVMLPLAYVFQMTEWGFPGSLLAAWALTPILTLLLMWRRWRSGRWMTDQASRAP